MEKGKYNILNFKLYYIIQGKNMLEKILTMLVKKANPKRDVSVEKIGKRFFIHAHDTIGCNDYLLDGQYSYDEVLALNNLTGTSS